MILSDQDMGQLSRYLARVLDLHANGVIDTEQAVAELAHTICAVDNQSFEAHSSMKTLLEKVWAYDAKS